MPQNNELVDNQEDIKTEEEHPGEEEISEVVLSEDELKQACHEQICPECELLTREKEKTLRTLADTENFKKRLEREKNDFCKYAVTSFVEDIIPVLDNLELALEHGKKNQACKELVQGIEMTIGLFTQVLEKNNLTQVGSVGDEFDPGIHEALAQEERDDMQEGSVCQVLQKGYVLNDRLIRPAKVMVSKLCDK